MIRGLYSAGSALVIASEQQEVTAHNLAHSTTPGYRERGLVFESLDRHIGHAEEPTGDITGARTVQAYNDFRPGPIQQTGHPYDLAIGEADRFFVLNGPNGPLYTRNGCFRVDPQGRLVSQAGYALQTDQGNVTIPEGTSRVVIASDGSITADGQPLGTVRLARFADTKQLTAAGPTLYTASPQAGRQDAPGRVIQGSREGSNVEPAAAMVRLIIGARYYDAAQRALRAQAESLQLNTRPQT
ncbi:Flagellar basal-body rod protein FlgF [Gemmata obscuriglobus]|uniref:Uncharacterized protein n=1 Tax=Gemmata obscuriglobus TaxID=114 RepID=A0A2Z3GVM8_9BACT|nr:flagellar hook basal-body protein [Gemmata obscuriglobus]AWM37368.1 hypothetical protein C1280_10345 [Gemmata obscuriglobus]QEG29872.1 Flagellar basal-body rod protein FlgF [Gemmata obscuriglobus]VTS09190.1 Flagellar basal body rod protein FlgG OS=uncultured planctomycete GN=HGMM_F33C03C05 PE=4 SV=1: Flg_bbr_C [Gemmata obscuriglobus UQM 2246]